MYEQIALSKDKSEVLRLSLEGNVIAKPQDIVKHLTILEFLGIEEKSKYKEKISTKKPYQYSVYNPENQ